MRTWFAPTLMLSSFLTLALAHWWVRRDYVAFHDELLYLLQGSLMHEPGFARPGDESLSPFFRINLTISDSGRLYTHFPPGQPAILAAFDAVGLRWWTGVVASTAGVWFTYLLGRDLVSQRVGLLAAAILATNGYFMAYGSSYMAHGVGVALSVASAWLIFRGSRSDGWPRAGYWIGAGLLSGSLVAVRPLSGGAITLSLVLCWVLWERRWRELPTLALYLGIGSALPFATILAYNDATNGSPFVFGYTALHGSLHDIGFGLRGYVNPGPDGRLMTNALPFTPRQAALNSVDLIGELVRLLFPTLLLAVPLMLIAAQRRLAVRYAPVAAFLILPIIHFFYFAPHSRFYLELFPFLFIGVALLLERIGSADRRLARSVAVGIVAAQVLFAGFHLRRVRGQMVSYQPVLAHVREAQASTGKLLLFVKGERLMFFLSWFNIGDFPGDVVVARDLGEENVQLVRRFPDHNPVRIDSVTRRIVPIPRAP